MKKITLTLFAAVLFIGATLNASAQKEETRKVSGFNGISSGGSFDVHVKIDGTESLKISGDAVKVDEIETVVEDGRLVFRYKDEHQWRNENDNKVNIYITAKSLSALTLGGSGMIKLDGTLTGENVKITIGGSGNITAAIKSSSVHISIGGSGSAALSGSADDGNISIGGSGHINAHDLKLETAHVSIGGSGMASVNVNKTVYASIAGSGHITYSGNATVNEVNARRWSNITHTDK